MNQFSPNLKPKPLHTHSDKAQRLGVPRTNILDLRKEPAETEHSAGASAGKAGEQPKLNWWQRRKLVRREAAEQSLAVQHQPTSTPITIQHTASSVETAPEPISELTQEPISDELIPDIVETAVSEDALVAAPVPEEAKIHQSALHETVEYDDSVEQRAQQKAAERAAKLEAKLEAKRQKLEARRIAKFAAQQAREHRRETALAERQREQIAIKQVRSAAASGHSAVRLFMQQTVRSLAVFALMLTVLISPFAALGFYKHVSTIRDSVVEVSEEAVAQLALGGQSAGALDFLAAQQAFGNASLNFKQAHDELLSVSSVMTPLVRVLPEAGDQFSSAENILLAGEQISAAGEDVAKAFSILSSLDVVNGADSTKGTSITDALVVAHSALRPAVPRLHIAALALQEIDSDSIPESYREDIQTAQTIIPQVAASVEQMLELSETMLVILGHDESKRYLVLFQNNAEMRPTGGFIGSFAVVDIRKGRVSNLEIPYGGPYDLLHNNTYKVISPTPLHLVNPHWQMQDANWWPHTPSSFQLVQKMYRKQGGSSVDGVISLTPDVIERMLEITGPIAMPEYNGTLATEETDGTEDVVITSENFYRYTQEQAERKFDDTNDSKKFISDLTPKILNRLFSLEAKNALPVLQLFYSTLNEKDILLYFNDQFLQAEMNQRGWTGEVEATSNDYLQVVDTNIAGGKTNRAITKVIHHQADIQADGKIIVTTEVTWNHQGKSGDVLEDVKNINYVRLYVPEGSQLVSAEGFTQPNPKLFLDPAAEYVYSEDLQNISGDILIDEATKTRINTEFNKTVFGNFVETAPGETSRISIQYVLPFTIDTNNLLSPADAYSILIQKQPGDFDPLVISSVTYPKQYSVRWSYPEVIVQPTPDQSQHTVTLMNAQLSQDIFAGLVLEQ